MVSNIANALFALAIIVLTYAQMDTWQQSRKTNHYIETIFNAILDAEKKGDEK